MNSLEEFIASVVLRLRRGDPPQDLLQEVKGVNVESQLYEEILESVAKQLANSLDERSLFGRLVKLDEEGLRRIKDSSDEFLEFEPFKGVKRVEVLEFWSKVLNIVLAGLREEESSE